MQRQADRFQRLAWATGTISLLSGLLFGGVLPAWSQQKPPSPPVDGAQRPPEEAPAITYGDWALRCVVTLAPAEAKGAVPLKTCEIAQTVQLKGQSTILAQLAVGRTKPGEPLRLTIVLPPNVGLPSTVGVVVDEKSKSRLELAWRRCGPGACVAELSLTDKAIEQLRGAKGTPHIAYPNAAGEANAVAFSFNGFGEALDALNKAYR